MNRVFTSSVIGLGAALAIGGCGSDEATASEDHTPVRMLLIVGSDTMTTDTLFLPAGQTVTVRGSFYTAADDNLDDHEAEHWSRLSFNPGTLATAVVDGAHHYSHEVAVQGAPNATGTVEVGYGHDALADEHTLSAPVKVIP